jgi:cytochrome c biogenesis protein CcdA
MRNPQNDIDKRKYNQKRFFHVFVFPSALAISVCLISYLLTDVYDFNRSYRLYGCLTGIIVGLILYNDKRLSWQPFPDSPGITTDSLRDHTNITIEPNQHYAEPIYYEAEFYFSTVLKILFIIFGLAFVACGGYIYTNSNIIRRILLMVAGIYFLGFGLKEVISKSPKLKIAKEGLWTRKLGFMPWEIIEKAEVITEKTRRSSRTYLEIHLTDSDTAPQQKLTLDYITGREKIQPLIDKFSRQ